MRMNLGKSFQFNSFVDVLKATSNPQSSHGKVMVMLYTVIVTVAFLQLVSSTM